MQIQGNSLIQSPVYNRQLCNNCHLPNKSLQHFCDLCELTVTNLWSFLLFRFFKVTITSRERESEINEVLRKN